MYYVDPSSLGSGRVVAMDKPAAARHDARDLTACRSITEPKVNGRPNAQRASEVPCTVLCAPRNNHARLLHNYFGEVYLLVIVLSKIVNAPYQRGKSIRTIQFMHYFLSRVAQNE